MLNAFQSQHHQKSYFRISGSPPHLISASPSMACSGPPGGTEGGAESPAPLHPRGGAAPRPSAPGPPRRHGHGGSLCASLILVAGPGTKTPNGPPQWGKLGEHGFSIMNIIEYVDRQIFAKYPT